MLLTVTILALASVLASAPGVARPAHSTPSALEPFLPRVAAASADHATPAGASSRLLLVENAGQWSDGARFQAWGGPGTMWLAENAIWITMVQQPVSSSAHHGVNLKLSFVDANPHPLIESLGRQATKVSYLFGSDPDQWHAEVPVWSEVRYDELYPGVDLVLGADASATLPWSFETQPGAEFERGASARRGR